MELISDRKTLVVGSAQGKLLSAEVGLSFSGGVDPMTGVVIDQHHRPAVAQGARNPVLQRL